MATKPAEQETHELLSEEGVVPAAHAKQDGAPELELKKPSVQEGQEAERAGEYVPWEQMEQDEEEAAEA